MEEELDDDFEDVIYQHRDLYSFIRDKYEYDKQKDLFIIGKSNIDTIIQVGYNYEDKHFMLVAEYNNETVYIFSFKETKQFKIIVNLLVTV